MSMGIDLHRHRHYLSSLRDRPAAQPADAAVPQPRDAGRAARLIRKAPTDADPTISYEPEHRPEVANLLTIAAGFTGTAPETLAEGLSGGSALKKLVTEAVNEGPRGQRERRAQFAADPAQLLQILHAGNVQAQAVADTTLAEVRQAMSMDY